MAPGSQSHHEWVEGWRATAAREGCTLLQAALRSGGDAFARFRSAVLRRVMVVHFHQRPGEVQVLLTLDAGGPVHPVAEDPEAEREEGGLTELPLQPGMWPVEELFLLASEIVDDPRSWAALGAEPRTAPVAFLAKHAAWRVRDRLRRGGGAAAERAPRPPGRQHELAGWLELAMAADPECEGPVPEARGLYTRLLTRIREHLAEAGEGSGGLSYALRKLFPFHAWPPEPGAGRGAVAAWVHTGVEARVGPLAPERGVALARCWEGAPPGGVREGLDGSALAHHRDEDYPGWREVALWTGDLAPDAPEEAELGTFMRRVSRLDQELRPYVERQVNLLRGLVGAP